MEEPEVTPSHGRQPELSVVIPSYNPGDDLFRCLESLSRQTLDRPFEILIVDSSPMDPTSRIQNAFPHVRVVHLKKRTLPGKARSEGASQARGEIVFFIDTDCVADERWLEELLESHRDGYRVAGGSVVNGTPRSIVGTTEYLL